ncbi:hypothetical protein ACIQ7D_22430 [Streptomyces sp. NPDC096310]|uniref:hypothetical protein n=1 Tax=Streptomyces sp. NPDC096310 TaxID=3366082 RepID=UPI0037FB985C
MAKRAVRKRARKILGEEPVALVWCEIRKAIPTPPKDVHLAAGKGRLKPRHHWLLYVGGAVFFFVVVPIMVIDKLGELIPFSPSRQRGRRSGGAQSPPDARPSGPGQDPTNGIFDGDWNLTAGQLLLQWYGHSPNPQRLVMLARDRICVAASPRRLLSPTKADDFRSVAEFPFDQGRVEGEAGQPRGFATFRFRFADGSWLEVGGLAEPEDADHFLRTISD